MRILVANKYFAQRGGAESVVLQTARLLESAGHEVVPFAMHYEGNLPTEWSRYFVPEREYFEGSIRRRAGDSIAAIYSFEAKRRIRDLLDVARPDLAHLHNVYHQLSLSIVDELRARSIPMVMTLHDYKPACPNYQLLTHDGLCQRCLGGAYWNAVRHRCLKGSIAGSAIAAAEAYVSRLRRQYSKIDLFLSPSRFLRDVMVRAGIPEGRIAVLPNAVRASGAARPLPETPRFVYFGRLSPEKGLDTLLAASAKTSSAAEIVVFGAGPQEEHLRHRIARDGLRVELRGFVSPETLRKELASTTAALLPAEWFENCPMSILEAGAVGVPTIASEIGGIPELIANGDDGLLIPPGDARALADAVDELALDRDCAARLGEGAHARVSTRHDEAGYTAALLQFYGELVGGRRARSVT